jgi:drug/metabolite transporter (DMT)-like permease
MTAQAGILLALACAFATNLAFLYKHRGARAAPDVDWRHPAHSAAGLFRSRWFAFGMLIAVGAWLLHVAALAVAPLSLVQAVISAGLVFLAVLAERVFGLEVGPRQWLGIGLTAIGLVLLTATLPSAAGDQASYSLAAMIAFEAALLSVGTLLLLSHRLGAPRHHHALMLGTAAGVLFGVSDVAIKALTGAVADSGTLGLVSPWLAPCVIGSVIAFYASARGLQKGDAVPVITLTSVSANVSSITGGLIVFGDAPSDPVAIVLQGFAFLLVIVAAALMPAPVRLATAS